MLSSKNPYPNHITALLVRESDRISGMDCTLRVRTTCTYLTKCADTIRSRYDKTYNQNNEYDCTHIHTCKEYESRSL